MRTMKIYMYDFKALQLQQQDLYLFTGFCLGIAQIGGEPPA